jgi:WD40 repeat protein/subtilisin-like proprotein convertase family protein
LLAAIAAERFAYVLAPRASGKSSLMGRTIRRLRAEGQLAAVVDLTQIGTRTETVDSTRWHYSIAYRICRELRLKIDLQAWWHERSLLLNDQRLVEFFWDIVLGHTKGPVTIFFDDAERAVDLPFSGEFFAAMQSCYTRRVSEPEYSRLNFVVLGAASPAQLCPDPAVSPFVAGRAISLDDFTLEECFALAPGLGQPEPVARRLLERIYTWTHGQPYLTQKLARGVVRKGGRLADVDVVLHELFLGPAISREEPYLSHMRRTLADGSARSRQALSILGRLAKGQEVIYDPASAAQTSLHLEGLVSSDENGMLRFRSRIVEQSFDPRWARSTGLKNWRPSAAAAAAAVAGLLLFGFWYVRILPRPYVDTLTLVSSDYTLALQAHQRLSRLPGFGRYADRLLTDVMVGRSTEAQTMEEVKAADTILRELPGRGALADELMAGFWLRRAEAEANRGNRDGALVQAIAAIDAGSMQAGPLATNLVDGDYAELEQTFYVDQPLVDIAVDWERSQIIGLDASQRLHRMMLSAGSGPMPAAGGPQPAGAPAARLPASGLTALQHVSVSRELFVDEPGRAGSLQLRLVVEHGRPSDLLVRLRAPSGATADVSLPRRDGALQQFVFTATPQNGLSRLADESITGPWELTVFDRLTGESGRLISWGLSFPGIPQFWDDDPVEGLPLPDPMETHQVAVTLARDGRRALAVPSRADARGAASVWDLATGEHLADLPLADNASFARFVGDDHLLIAGPVRATLWHLGDSQPVTEIVAVDGFASAPAVSPDGRFFAVAETEAGEDRVQVSLFSLDQARVVSRFETEPWIDWTLASGAGLIAAFDSTRHGRAIDPMTGKLVAEFFPEHELTRLLATPDKVVAVDDSGAISSFGLDTGQTPLMPRDSMYLGSTVDAASVGISADDELVSFVGANGLVNVVQLSNGYPRAVFGHGGGRVIGAWLNAGADRVVSAAGNVIRSWRVPKTAPAAHDFGDISTIAIADGGDFGVLGYRNGQVRMLRDLPAAVELDAPPPTEYFGHRGVVTSLAINGNGSLAASGGSDGLVRIWDTQTGSPNRYLMRHPEGPIDALAFSPDGRWIVSAGPRSARVFELETGALANEVEVDGEALSVAFSPDARILAIGDSAGNIYLASPDGTQGVLAIRGRSAITALAFADTPEILASGSSDGNLVLWDTLEARAIEGAHRFPAPIRWIDMAPGATEIGLQSGGWLYRLDRSGAEPAVTGSSLLPASLRDRPALARIGGRRFRAMANAGGGHLVLADVDLTPTGTQGADTAAMLAGRDWARVLGLMLDPATGAVSPTDPER